MPDEKQVDQFITMMGGEAQKAGVELRRYTAKDTKSQQYYTEVPFDLELDGPYYSTLNFFDRVSKLERIVNISKLLVATTKTPSGGEAKHTYQYAPNESVVATFTATTYFSHDAQPSARQEPELNPARPRRSRDTYEAAIKRQAFWQWQ